MESWRLVWRDGFVPLLSTAALQSLRDGLAKDDPPGRLNPPPSRRTGERPMTTEPEVLNALAVQNDAIAAAVAAATDAAGLTKAVKLLAFVKTLWVALGYGYKVGEVAGRVRRKAAFLANMDREFHRQWPGQDRKNLTDLEELEEYDAK